LREVAEEQRTPDQWWMLGEYLVYGGIINEDDSAINEGTAVLMKGASQASPSIACLMDLAWVLSYRGLDAVALPYIERASELVPDSRDVLSLKALVQMGIGDAAQPIASFARACEQPNATNVDRETLDRLKRGDKPSSVRKSIFLRKIGLDDPDLAHHPLPEQALAAAHILKPLNDADPANGDVAYGLAYARYSAGQLDRARLLLQPLVADHPEHADAWTMLGLIAKKSNDADRGMQCYERALAANPDHILALVNSASRLSDAGDPFTARARLQHALDLSDDDNPHHGIALDLMGNTYALIECLLARSEKFELPTARFVVW